MPFRVLRKGLAPHESPAAFSTDSKGMEQRLGCFPSLYVLIGGNSNAKLAMKNSPNRDIFRRDLSNPDLSSSSRRSSMDINHVHLNALAANSRPRRSSIRLNQQQQEDRRRDDERGFLDRAFESAFTFDFEEQQ